MPSAIRVVDRIQDQADFGGSVGDGKVLQWVAANSRFEPTTPTGGGSLQVIGSPVTLGADAAWIDFDPIPGTYHDLELLFVGRSAMAAATDQLELRCNADTGANYNTRLLYGIAGGAGTGFVAAQTSARMGNITGNGGTIEAGSAGTAIIRIPGYAGTTYHKRILSLWGKQNTAADGGTDVGENLGIWRSAAAITALRLFALGGNLKAGAFAVLYGRSG